MMAITMLREIDGDTLIDVRVRPRARRTGIDGRRGERLLVSVTAPPLDGRANDALCRLLAKALGIAPGRVTVTTGAGARDKTVRIGGIDPRNVAGQLGLGDE